MGFRNSCPRPAPRVVLTAVSPEQSRSREQHASCAGACPALEVGWTHSAENHQDTVPGHLLASSHPEGQTGQSGCPAHLNQVPHPIWHV